MYVRRVAGTTAAGRAMLYIILKAAGLLKCHVGQGVQLGMVEEAFGDAGRTKLSFGKVVQKFLALAMD